MIVKNNENKNNKKDWMSVTDITIKTTNSIYRVKHNGYMVVTIRDQFGYQMGIKTLGINCYQVG